MAKRRVQSGELSVPYTIRTSSQHSCREISFSTIHCYRKKTTHSNRNAQVNSILYPHTLPRELISTNRRRACSWSPMPYYHERVMPRYVFCAEWDFDDLRRIAQVRTSAGPDIQMHVGELRANDRTWMVVLLPKRRTYRRRGIRGKAHVITDGRRDARSWTANPPEIATDISPCKKSISSSVDPASKPTVNRSAPLSTTPNGAPGHGPSLPLTALPATESPARSRPALRSLPDPVSSLHHPLRSSRSTAVSCGRPGEVHRPCGA